MVRFCAYGIRTNTAGIRRPTDSHSPEVTFPRTEKASEIEALPWEVSFGADFPRFPNFPQKVGVMNSIVTDVAVWNDTNKARRFSLYVKPRRKRRYLVAKHILPPREAYFAVLYVVLHDGEQLRITNKRLTFRAFGSGV
jgi:hypothetical protein